ncbi:MAG: hypothetical protein IPL82_06375 [Elusimicrobia bacterium]|nr:hypothetical protein [Elusimicrobiota bacterium]
MTSRTLQHIELIALDPRRLLAVLVSDTGVVRHRQVLFEAAYPRELLEPLARLLNERLRGQPFARARRPCWTTLRPFTRGRWTCWTLRGG